jgi:hypothetical protein
MLSIMEVDVLRIVQTALDTPLKWYTTRFNLNSRQVKLLAWILSLGFLLLNVILVILVLSGILPRP